MLSTFFLNDPTRQVLIDDSPWKLGNTDRKLVTSVEEKPDTEMIEHYQSVGIDLDMNGLATGLDYTFTELWSALHQRDTAQISLLCEGQLRKAFIDFYDALDEEDCELIADS